MAPVTLCKLIYTPVYSLQLFSINSSIDSMPWSAFPSTPFAVMIIDSLPLPPLPLMSPCDLLALLFATSIPLYWGAGLSK